jgi:acyl-CoA hydrolase
VVDERREHRPTVASTKAVVLVRHNAGVTVAIDSISFDGAIVVGEIAAAVGESVQILFALRGIPVDVRAEVVRAEKLDMTTDRIAVRFVEIPDNARDLLRDLFEPHDRFAAQDG